MKSFKSLALVFAEAIISFGSFAQASTTKPADKPAAKAVGKTTTTNKTAAKKADVKKTDAKAAPAAKK